MDKRFTTTHWSVVQAAADSAHPQSDAALARLCEAYWTPVYAYVCRQVRDREAARDLTQGFFAELLERKRVKAADPERGRFRSFLLASVKNYIGHERARAQAAKRGGGAVTLQLDFDAADTLLGRDAIERHTPEVLFERRWAVSVLARAMELLGEEMERKGKGAAFRVLQPCLAGEAGVPYQTIAAELGVSEQAARVTLHRLRRRFGELLREQVAETLADPALLEDEMSFLLAALS